MWEAWLLWVSFTLPYKPRTQGSGRQSDAQLSSTPPAKVDGERRARRIAAVKLTWQKSVQLATRWPHSRRASAYTHTSPTAVHNPCVPMCR
jgi:hypothetical protein